MQKPMVFFDGNCPVCSREIRFYRRRRGAEQIVWVDVNSCESATLPPGLDRASLLERFHVTDRQGNVNDGASAFIALWRELPGLKLLARIAGSKPVLPILEVLYLLFLKLRSSR